MNNISPELHALADYSGLVHVINSASAANAAVLACLIRLAEYKPESQEYMLNDIKAAVDSFKELNDALKIVNDRLVSKMESDPVAMSISAILKAKK